MTYRSSHTPPPALARDARVVVVGASLAGLRTVESLRSHGFAGPITMLSAEDVAPYDRPPLSKQFLTGAWDAGRITLRSEAELGALNLDLRLSSPATSLNLATRSVCTSAGAVRFDALILATGVRPRTLPASLVDPGLKTPSVHTIRTLADSEALRPLLVEGARVVVVGAGFIGAEVAAAAASAGATVTIVEQLPVPLGRALGDAMGKACGSLHARHNVTLRCGVEVIAITDGCVFLGDGSTLGADIVVVGIGTIPNTEWLANPSNHPSNPAPDAPGDPVLDIANGIAVDEYCRALSPSGKVIDGVYAVGDVARFPLVWPVSVAGDSARVPEFVRIEHWTNAAEMGAHVGEVMTGAPSPFQSVPYFWSDQYNHKIQFLGRATSFDEVRIVGGSVEEGAWLALYRVGDRLTAALGVSKIRALAPYRRLLAEGASWQKALDAAPQS